MRPRPDPSVGPSKALGAKSRAGRHGLLLLGALIGLAACNRIEARRGAPVGSGPNVLLVTIDTLRADHVGVYGAAYAATPNLDRLGAEGVRFETAIASSPLTLPSHASILTGRYPPGVGVRHNGVYRLAESAESVAERLRAAGYDTGAFVSAFVLAARFGLAQGFDHYDADTSLEYSGPGGYLERRADAVTDRAISWLASAERPFFLWIHYYDPHARYRPPPPFTERFAERPYDGEVAYVDAEFGRLLKGLRDSGELDRTFVIATSDHGESLGEHGEPDHGYTLYDAVLRVPLLLRGPGLPSGKVVGELVRGVDIAPTLLALLDLEPLSQSDGVSLEPLWRDAGTPPGPAYAETLAPELELGWSPLYAVRTPRFHYVRAPRPELYEVSSDPRQRRNLLEHDPQRAKQIADELDAQIDAILAQAVEEQSGALDPETRERLNALGYALPAQPPPRTGLDPKDGLRLLGDFWAANEAYARKDFSEARELLDRVLERMPESSRAHALLAFLHLHTGDPGQALPHMEAAADLAPRSAYYRALVGEIQQELGNAQAARAAFHAAAALDPSEPLAQIGLMGEQARQGNLAAAELHARTALAGASRDATVRLKIGKVWAGVGVHARALEAFQDAVRLDPDSEYARMQLCIALARMGRAEASRKHRAQAGEMARDPWLVSRLGLAHARGGNLESAEAVLRELLQAHPDYRPARRGLARVLRASGRAEEAESLEATDLEAKRPEADGGAS
jgi:arylsulfatase A-like enzyme/Flp pilus assembly protein TadD